MSIGRIILLIVATIAVAIWCVLAIKYEQTYAEITESIDETKYRYPELFCIGFAIMKISEDRYQWKTGQKADQRDCGSTGKKVCGILLLYYKRGEMDLRSDRISAVCTAGSHG